MTKVLFQPLQSHHSTEAFTCGQADLDAWLRQTARQHGRKGVSRAFVAVSEEKPSIPLGFYSLTVSEADFSALPKTAAKHLPRRIPAALLGRLAVALDRQGQGLGAQLLMDALHRIWLVAQEIGIAFILVDAKDDGAARFYQRYGFQPLPDAPLRLALPVQTLNTLFSLAIPD